MADFASHFTNLRLYEELGRSAGRDEIDRAEVTQLQALVVEVAEKVGPLLKEIANTFHQYTGHDIHHCRNVADRMGRLIPRDTLERMNGLELALLLLSALLHDIGMAVTDREKAATFASPAFKRFCEESHSDRIKAASGARNKGEEWRARLIEDALLADYYRRLHAARVHRFLSSNFHGKLLFREVSYAQDLGNLCESHVWAVDESLDPSQPGKAVARLPTESLYGSVRVNLQYLACCLRLADIMDFDRSRTPLSVFQHLTLTEPRSWEEWNKHLQVKGWLLEPDRVVFEIRCSHPAFLVAVQEFLGWIDQELGTCRALTERQPEKIAKHYQLRLPQLVDRSKVQMEDSSYLAGAFRFQLEYEEILRLLMDKSLYPDPSLFLRELLQNSLDACRRKEAEAKLAGKKYEARIVARDFSDDPEDPRIEFEDNGVGMSLRIVEQYFLRVGKSYYRSQEFDAERRRLAEAGIELDACSQFGIGILSCFLVCDRFEVLTQLEGGELLHLEVEGPSRYFSIRRMGARAADEEFGKKGSMHGTRVIVHLCPGIRINCAQVLDIFAVNVDFPIVLEDASGKPVVTIGVKRWEGRDICADFPQIGFAIYVGAPDQTTKPVPTEPLFVASRIPFELWDFSHHFRGRAWFWLLRGPDSKPALECGQLALAAGSLELRGAAAFLQDLLLGEAGERRLAVDEVERVIESIGHNLDWDGVSDALSPIKAVTDDQTSLWSLPMSVHSAKKLLGAWAKLVLTERQAVIQNLREWRRRPGPFWLESGLVLRQLLHGSLDWAQAGISFRKRWGAQGLPQVAHSLALSSVRLPGGVVSWNPKEGRARPLSLLPWPGGVQIDLRGPNAPRPSANRLWIDRREGEDFLRAFYRGLIRHAAELAGEGSPSRKWRSWLWQGLRKIPEDIASQVRTHEAGYLANQVGYLCLHPDGSLVRRAKTEMTKTWRVWTNESGDSRPGVLLDDELNRWLVGMPLNKRPNRGSLLDWDQMQ